MKIALDTPTQEASNKSSRPRATWLMTVGFLIYTLLILIGHTVGFPLGYAYLHTVCPSECSLTPEDVHALEYLGLSIAFSANLYMAIQVFYILVSVGIELLIVFKKPGQWVPLGLSCFLVWFSAYEGADYPALLTAHPECTSATSARSRRGILSMYTLLTFPNGRFGSLWVLGFYLVNVFDEVLSVFITNPVSVLVNNVRCHIARCHVSCHEAQSSKQKRYFLLATLRFVTAYVTPGYMECCVGAQRREKRHALRA